MEPPHDEQRRRRERAMLRRATSRLALRTPAAATRPLLYRPPLHPGQGPVPIAQRFSPSLVRCFASGQTPPPTDKKEPSRWERIKAMFYEHGPVFVACAGTGCGATEVNYVLVLIRSRLDKCVDVL